MTWLKTSNLRFMCSRLGIPAEGCTTIAPSSPPITCSAEAPLGLEWYQCTPEALAGMVYSYCKLSPPEVYL
eukprot:CAMPEP_0173298512 /NCGR_PEP_ID=MMETSP1143-20121109/16137_1 /TAXON_ID=483371 /ORGANISM="non described non described, Strain CCMP2298" /LENGTH=70 /DNA_ID=CAMNT_0014238643 /DNA_START=2266 /DNA_END=2478 /DNA_ORIENTATION=+